MRDHQRVDRRTSLGERNDLTAIDRLGQWLGRRILERVVGTWEGKHVLDVGCGFNAHATEQARERAESVTLIDLAIAPELRARSGTSTIEGSFPAVAADLTENVFDVVLLLSVLEHLDDDHAALKRAFELLAPGGTMLVGVPTWWGKRFLEFFSFRMRWATADEMDDHRRYYDLPDLWPLLVSVGFRPRSIRCRRAKLGFNLFAVCTKSR